ncbi:MAG: hypothetical protein P4L73_18580 [Caulobacteraceae bacterium]|nr:hypothetical protein [Caulobacteraceae bacterium]
MKRNTALALAAQTLAALGLSACDRHDGRMVNAAICPDFRATSAPQAGAAPSPADAAAPVDECVRRWAFSLAGARDGADVVADAAVAACGPVLTRWNQAGLAQEAQSGGAGGPVEAVSITTGLPTNALAEHAAFAHGRALLYVTEARAGRCAPPPVKNGAPAGT